MNKQPIEKRELRTDNHLVVHSIFRTIQGEGPFCGVPCVFVRLAGCNLQCPSCDTDYTSNRQLMSVDEIIQKVGLLSIADQRGNALVVITGGEPFRQELEPLLGALCTASFYVQIETNGTLAPTKWEHIPGDNKPWRYSFDPGRKRGVYVVCSPKTGKVNPEIFKVACALKYVVKRGAIDDDGLPTSALDHYARPARPPEDWERPIYVQPIDTKNVVDNDLHTAAAVDSCMEHGYTLQLQIHKFIGVE